MDNIVIEKLAYEHDEGDYHFVVTYLTEPKGYSLVEIKKNGVLVKETLWPSYKIYNIAAHSRDIVEDIEQGLREAGSTGLGGNVYG